MSGLTHLDRLEAESIHIMRETVAEAARPVMLYSIGKDSAVMLHLARKAFYPAPLPFPLLHVDTTWKFQDMYRLRDKVGAEEGIELIVYKNPEAEAKGINPFDHGPLHTDLWKIDLTFWLHLVDRPHVTDALQLQNATDEQRQQMEQQRQAAEQKYIDLLAKNLGLDSATVKSALEQTQKDLQAQRVADIQQAVTDGKLTQDRPTR